MKISSYGMPWPCTVLLGAWVGVHAPAHADVELETIAVTGQAARETAAPPIHVVGEETLKLRAAGTLGEALRYTPGLDATGFGPNASRPIIRGQDGDRIRILRNSAALVDVSALSFDHAVPVDPFAISRVEVLRGPGTLAYGGNAVGGVVNVVDQRIARQFQAGLQAAVNGVYGGPASLRAQGAQLQLGVGQALTLSLDGFRRHTGGQRTPSFTDPEGVVAGRVRNSAAQSEGSGVGLSWQLQNGYVGLSAERVSQLYGVPSEATVSIDLQNTRYALEGENTGLGGPWKTLRYRLAHTAYRHQELDDGAPATLFTNRGEDGRFELSHTPWALLGRRWEGLLGLQFEQTQFAAVGEEAFAPSSKTRQQGLFYILRSQAQDGQLQDGQPAGPGLWELGLRQDRVQVDAASTGLSPAVGPVAGAGVAAGPAQGRSFSPQAWSLAYTKPVGQGWSLGGNVARLERAPTAYELYADGVHVATSAYEKGNAQLGTERGRHGEVNAVWQGETSRVNLAVYQARFSSYVGLLQRAGADATFQPLDGLGQPEGDPVPVFDFTAVPATLRGVELGWNRQWANPGLDVQLNVQYSLVRGKRRDTAEGLPRISPQRLLLSLPTQYAGWSWVPEWVWVDKSKGSPTDPSTLGYSLYNLRASKPVRWAGGLTEVSINLENLTDQLAFSATTINTVRGFAPLPGRSLTLGLRWVLD